MPKMPACFLEGGGSFQTQPVTVARGRICGTWRACRVAGRYPAMVIRSRAARAAGRLGFGATLRNPIDRRDRSRALPLPRGCAAVCARLKLLGVQPVPIYGVQPLPRPGGAVSCGSSADTTGLESTIPRGQWSSEAFRGNTRQSMVQGRGFGMFKPNMPGALDVAYGRPTSHSDRLVASGTGHATSGALTFPHDGHRRLSQQQRRTEGQLNDNHISRLREREESKRLKKFKRSPRKLYHQMWVAPQSASESKRGFVWKSARQADVKLSTPASSYARTANSFYQPAAQKPHVVDGLRDARAWSEQEAEDMLTQGTSATWRPQVSSSIENCSAEGPDEELQQTTEQQEERKLPFIVDSPIKAREAIRCLKEFNNGSDDIIFACDTEVANINVAKESPCGHGDVICFSIYSRQLGSSGQGQMKDICLWVDTMKREEGDPTYTDEVWAAFKDFWEDDSFKKVWHNYGFDRHVLENMGVESRGFAGDTMHMARLWDSSRKGKGYSLEALTSDAKIMGNYTNSKKTSMKALFGKKYIKKDGTEGKAVVVPPVDELQTSAETRQRWIDYSALDAEATFNLYCRLSKELSSAKLEMDGAVHEGYRKGDMETLWDFYHQVWRPFGELLTDMENEGFLVDVTHLAAAQTKAEDDKAKAGDRFRNWACQVVEDAKDMNVNSDIQIRTLFFAGVPNQKAEKGSVEIEKTFKAPNPDYEAHVKSGTKGKAPKKTKDISLHSVWGKGEVSRVQPEIFTASGWPAASAAALRVLAGKAGVARTELEKGYGVSQVPDNRDILESALLLEDSDADPDAFRIEFNERLKRINAEAQGLGKLYSAFDDGREGLEACAAVESLLEVGAIDTLLSSFILPLQEDNIKTPDGRVHASLNINTETGRLSCRRPNLQNQPALEKDRYQVRRAFTADKSKGHTLVVADYGQLELRILAHLTRCRSMLDAFERGGDFHSRTAVGMYDYIQSDIDQKKCLLEWKGGKTGDDPPPAPLVKEKFASERRKAKVLNFSIAYGKTAHGLSKDWKVSLEEAKETVERWYSDRQEVKDWQRETIRQGAMDGYVTTLLGRRRNLPDLRSSKRSVRSHAERAAINTPIQGSAADIATAAMLALASNERLRELGWKLLLQVHDEVVLEGPEEHAEEAQKIILQCMESPFVKSDGKTYWNPLSVALAVDSKIAPTWYEAK